MAKSTTPDVFDKSDEIEQIKSNAKPKKQAKLEEGGNDVGYMCGRGTYRRKTREDDKLFNIRISKSLHHRLREAAWDTSESMNLVCVRAIQEYLDNHGY